MKTIGINFWDGVEAAKDGKPLTWTSRIIMLRSPLVHCVVEFDANRCGVSWHCTQRNGQDGCGFEYITYSHEHRWKRETIIVTDEAESVLFHECCNMAGVPMAWQAHEAFFAKYSPDATYYQGAKWVEYDTKGLMSFALEHSPNGWTTAIRHIAWFWTAWVKPNPEKAWCSSAIARALNSVAPNMNWKKIDPIHIDPERLAEIVKEMK